MLVDLREMGMDARGGGPLLTRSISFKPFCYAVASNISAFFMHAPMAELSQVYTITAPWFTPEQLRDLNRVEYQHKLSLMAQGWMKKGRCHPSGIKLAAKHLRNVILLWPKHIVVPTSKSKANLEKRKQQRRERKAIVAASRK